MTFAVGASAALGNRANVAQADQYCGPERSSPYCRGSGIYCNGSAQCIIGSTKCKSRRAYTTVSCTSSYNNCWTWKNSSGISYKCCDCCCASGAGGTRACSCGHYACVCRIRLTH